MEKALDFAFRAALYVYGLSRMQKLVVGGIAVMITASLFMVGILLLIPVVFIAILFLPLTLLGGVSGIPERVGPYRTDDVSRVSCLP